MAAAQDTIDDLDDWQKDDPDYVDWIQEPDRVLKKPSACYAELLSRIENP
jgi:hypothetical protein